MNLIELAAKANRNGGFALGETQGYDFMPILRLETGRGDYIASDLPKGEDAFIEPRELVSLLNATGKFSEALTQILEISAINGVVTREQLESILEGLV